MMSHQKEVSKEFEKDLFAYLKQLQFGTVLPNSKHMVSYIFQRTFTFTHTHIYCVCVEGERTF